MLKDSKKKQQMDCMIVPIPSMGAGIFTYMYGIFTYVWLIFYGKYSIFTYKNG